MYPEYESRTRASLDISEFTPDELLLTNGGDDALRLFFDTFVEPNSRILICEPTFPMYRYWGEIAGANIDVLPLRSAAIDSRSTKSLPPFATKPRVLFSGQSQQSHRHTGRRRFARKILRAATHTVVVLDEAYAEFSGLPPSAGFVNYPNLFVARTFSKAAGLAALRLGAVLAHEDFSRHPSPRRATVPRESRRSRRRRSRVNEGKTMVAT